MKLNPTNFLNYLIFHPFQAKTTKGKIASLFASIVLGVCTLGLCHLTLAIRACWIKKPEGTAKKTDEIVKNNLSKKFNPPKHPAPSGDISELFPSYKNEDPKPSGAKFRDKFVPSVLEDFLRIFEYTSFLDKFSQFPSRKKAALETITSPLISGLDENQQPYVAFKLEELTSGVQCLFLLQSYKGAKIVEGEWKTFTDWTVILKEKSREVEMNPAWLGSKKEGLISVMNILFRGKEYTDIDGLTWKLFS